MSVAQALEILENIEKRKEEEVINKNTLVVGCARVGTATQIIKYGRISEIKEFDFGKSPHCLIIPGKLHFVEEEMLDLWK